MKYNKVYDKKDIKPGRKLYMGGPRDMQQRHKIQMEKDLFIKELQKEIRELNIRLKQRSEELNKTENIYTKEQVDDEINKAVVKALEENRDTNLTEYEKDVTKLKTEIIILKEKLSSREEMINEMKEVIKIRPTVLHEDTIIEDPDRPKMEDVFVDPTDEDYKRKLKTHIETVETTNKNVDLKSQVERLKEILGNKDKEAEHHE
jgi:hypothetical protein